METEGVRCRLRHGEAQFAPPPLIRTTAPCGRQLRKPDCGNWGFGALPLCRPPRVPPPRSRASQTALRQAGREKSGFDGNHGRHPEGQNPARLPRRRARPSQAAKRLERGGRAEERDHFEAIFVEARNSSRSRDAGARNEARKMFAALTTADPHHGRAWLEWARMEALHPGSSSLGHSASDIYHSGLQANPNNLHLCHAAASFAEKQGDLERARSLLQRCIEIDPNDAINYQTFARLEERTGNEERAKELFDKAVSVDPRNASCWNAYGTMEQKHGRLESASHKFKRALQVDPCHSRSWQCLGIVDSKLGHHEEATRSFQQAIDQDAGKAPAPIYNAWALAEYRRGRVDEARDLFMRGMQTGGQHAPLLHAFAVMEETEGNHDKARDLFEVGHKTDPRNSAMLRSWAAMELRLGHIDTSRHWQLDWKTRGPSRRMSRRDSDVAERLLMVSRLLTRRTDKDTRRVLKFLDILAKKDRRSYKDLRDSSKGEPRNLLRWAERRSAKDVKAFEAWFDRRYEEDRRVVSYMLGWKFPPRTLSRPVEWYQLDGDVNLNSLSDGDRWVTTNSNEPPEYAESLEWLAKFAENLGDRSALFLALATASLVVFSISVNGGLFEEIKNLSEIVAFPSPPNGIDAHLVEVHGQFN